MACHNWLNPRETPIVILSEGCFGELQSKTALGVIRYGQWPVVAVIDSRYAGQTVQGITGLQNSAPLVSTLEEALAEKPKALLLGTAPAGGKLPVEWYDIILKAIEAGLHIINGLHFFLKDDPLLAQKAATYGVMLWDVRDPDMYVQPSWHPVALQLPRPSGTHVVTFVGSDCSVGKMHAALSVHHAMQAADQRSCFMATGQTGILISNNGLPLDRVIGDFMAGYTESCLLELIREETPDWVFVEGQGSLLHPGFSSVTLALLHGSNPDGMILCHRPGLTKIRGEYHVPIPALKKLAGIYETAAAWVQPPQKSGPRVLAICLDTSPYPEGKAQSIIQAAQEETQLPVTDPIRFGAEAILPAIHRLKDQSPIWKGA